MQSRYVKLLAGAMVSLPMFVVPVLAAGSDSPPAQDTKCADGLVYNKKTKKCEPPKAGHDRRRQPL